MAHAESNLKTKSLGQSLDGRMASNGLADRCAPLSRKWAGFVKQAAWALVVMARLLLGCGLVTVDVLPPRKAAIFGGLCIDVHLSQIDTHHRDWLAGSIKTVSHVL